MRHMKKGSALNRSQSHRRWMLSNMVTSLFQHEQIRTTVAKAKEARPLAEKLITFAKRGDLHARRMVMRIVRDKEVVSKMFEILGIRYKDRPGGYTRIVKLGTRLGDAAPMAMIELVAEDTTKRAKRKRSRGRKKAAEEAQAAQAGQAATTGGETAAAGEQPAEKA